MGVNYLGNSEIHVNQRFTQIVMLIISNFLYIFFLLETWKTIIFI